jgi:hypothetical protein
MIGLQSEQLTIKKELEEKWDVWFWKGGFWKEIIVAVLLVDTRCSRECTRHVLFGKSR